ncbi:GNAT family N-acetyltransferase [Celeribacter litoreus]|uniref:GNAT family N-acetyltransferase n=1 Tax=Celeribacter litoreus TaxID=2876714 RepID=UPI001CCFD365|nr:GNAT family N-acetyltransferase [Celeribacter litoreus]MCA0043727.1 GNAT family N-acetyltransferase [Celeribacter litoreus]
MADDALLFFMIRPAELSDMDRLHAMMSDMNAEVGAQGRSLTKAELVDLLLAPAPWMRLIVAVQGAEIVGYACLSGEYGMSLQTNGLELWQIYVDPDWRHKGIGRAIINDCRKTARELGFDHLSAPRFSGKVDYAPAFRAYGFEFNTRAQPRLEIAAA